MRGKSPQEGHPSGENPSFVEHGSPTKRKWTVWLARISVLAVFLINVQCAIFLFFFPEQYTGAYELGGIPGKAAVQGLGVAFLMWNATYPLVIIEPEKHRTLYAVVLAQQTIGLIGESIILSSLPEGYAILSASILRFIQFDAGGLVIMAIGFFALQYFSRKAN